MKTEIIVEMVGVLGTIIGGLITFFPNYLLNKETNESIIEKLL
jgi:hypothetical protein